MELAALQTITLGMMIGVASYILSRWMRVPAIIFYLAAGLIAGKTGFGIIDTDALGQGLLVLVEITVAIILFEGGLSLSPRSFKSESSAIRRILIISLPLTGLGGALLAHYLLNLSWQISIFFGALIVVTGPTVVGSILKSVYLTRRLEILLNWESIWGDVIGVLLSAVALELVELNFQDDWTDVIWTLLLRIIGGGLLGLVGGYGLRWLMYRVCRLRDTTLPGILSITGSLVIFFTANVVTHSSGPLAVAVAGFILSSLNEELLHEIRHFKEQISSIFISTMFVLLSAFINPMPLIDLWPMMLLLAFIMGALVRPLSVLIALWKTPVQIPERIFIGIIGPRGIIAAATAAYAALAVSGLDKEMNVVLNLTYAVIFLSGISSTILCRPLARFLKVQISTSRLGLLIVGVNSFSSDIADFASRYIPVSFLETNADACLLAEHLGHDIICTDLLDSTIYEEAVEDGFGRLLALTPNEAMNQLIAKKASIMLEPQLVYWAAARTGSSSIKLADTLTGSQAFSSDFSLPQAVQQLDSHKAVLKVLQPDEIASRNAIPLMEVLKGNDGIRVVTSGMTVHNECLCLVLDVNDLMA